MIFLIPLILIFIIALAYFIFHDKLLFIEIKIDNIEEKLNSTLIKRKELLKDSESLIRSIVKTEKHVYANLEEIKDQSNMFEFDRTLLIYLNEFNLIKDKYEALNKNDDFQKLAFSINETEDLLNTYKSYYNDYAEKYNSLIKSFPIILTNIFKGRKKKNFFDNKNISDSDYNDFKY